MSAGERQLRADAAWYRAEHESLKRELAALTPARIDALGPAHVRRMRADVDTFRQLADEHDTYLADRYPSTPRAPADDPGLF